MGKDAIMIIKAQNVVLIVLLPLLLLTSCASERRSTDSSANDSIQLSATASIDPTSTAHIVSVTTTTFESHSDPNLPPRITCLSDYDLSLGEIALPNESSFHGLTWLENKQQFRFNSFYFDISTDSLGRLDFSVEGIRFIQPNTLDDSVYAFSNDSVERIDPESGAIVDADFDSVVEDIFEFAWITENERAVIVGMDRNREEISTVFDVQSNRDLYSQPFMIVGVDASQNHVVGLRRHFIGGNASGDLYSLFVLDPISMTAHEMSVGDCTSFPSVSVNGDIVIAGIRDVWPSESDKEDNLFDDQPDLYLVSADDIDSENVTLQRITNDSIWESVPVWSPDGESIVFFSSHQVDGQPTMQFCVISRNDDDWNSRSCQDVDEIDTDWLWLQVGRPTWSSDGQLIAVNINFSINLYESEFAETFLLYDVANNDLSYHTYDRATFAD